MSDQLSDPQIDFPSYIQGPICKEGENDCDPEEDLHCHCLDGTYRHSLIIDEQTQTYSSRGEEIETQVDCVICYLQQIYWDPVKAGGTKEGVDACL